MLSSLLNLRGQKTMVLRFSTIFIPGLYTRNVYQRVGGEGGLAYHLLRWPKIEKCIGRTLLL